jgi:hypothetical protein
MNKINVRENGTIRTFGMFWILGNTWNRELLAVRIVFYFRRAITDLLLSVSYHHGQRLAQRHHEQHHEHSLAIPCYPRLLYLLTKVLMGPQ